MRKLGVMGMVALLSACAGETAQQQSGEARKAAEAPAAVCETLTVAPRGGAAAAELLDHKGAVVGSIAAGAVVSKTAEEGDLLTIVRGNPSGTKAIAKVHKVDLAEGCHGQDASLVAQISRCSTYISFNGVNTHMALDGLSLHETSGAGALALYAKLEDAGFCAAEEQSRCGISNYAGTKLLIDGVALTINPNILSGTSAEQRRINWMTMLAGKGFCKADGAPRCTIREGNKLVRDNVEAQFASAEDLLQSLVGLVDNGSCAE